jgi:mono/diheme cytochrome c family protein
MKRLLKIVAMTLGALAGIALCAAVYVYIASERVIERTYDVALMNFHAPTDTTAIEAGRRLATIYGCNNCHAAGMNGTVLYDEPGIARISAPNVSRIVKEYSDAELERLIRHGVKRDGTSTWIMPAPMFSHLTDEDLGNIIAYVRSLPALDGVERELTLRPLGRIGIVTDKFRPLATEVTANGTARAPDRTDPMSHGKYLVMTACTECHGANLEGSDIVNAPSLLVAAAYSKEEFARLMRTGRGIGERKLGLMAEVGQVRFSSFTDAEVDAVRTYLEAFVRQGGTALP